MLKKILTSLLALFIFANQAHAGSSTANATAGTGDYIYSVITDGSGHFAGKFGLCDGTAIASCVTVTSGAATVAGSGTAGSATGGILTVQGVASMTPLLATLSGTNNIATVTTVTTVGAVTAITNALPAGTNVIGHIICDSGCSGSGGTAITDNAAFTTGTTSETPIGCYAGTPSATANHSTIVACTTAGSVHTTVDNATALGSAVSASSSPVVIASDQAAVAVKAASGALASGSIASGAIASGAFASGAFASGSFLNATAGDPCMFQAKTNVAISTASGTVALVAGVSAKKIYVCSFSLISSGAIAVSLSEGSGTTCGTSAQAGVIGVATNGTAANGLSLAANGGLTLGNGGGTVAATATAANYLCLFQSGTTQMAGNLTYVQQ